MRKHHIAGWIIGGLIIAYCYAFINAITTASENSGQCKALESAAINGHHIPMSVSQPNTPAAFCELGVHFPLLRTYFTVFIYGVLDRTEQDAIVGSIRNAPRAPNQQRILVQFFDKETGAPGPTPTPAAAAATAAPNTPSPPSGFPSRNPARRQGRAGTPCPFVQPAQANSDSSTEIQRFPLAAHSKVENT